MAVQRRVRMGPDYNTGDYGEQRRTAVHSNFDYCFHEVALGGPIAAGSVGARGSSDELEIVA